MNRSRVSTTAGDINSATAHNSLSVEMDTQLFDREWLLSTVLVMIKGGGGAFLSGNRRGGGGSRYSSITESGLSRGLLPSTTL